MATDPYRLTDQTPSGAGETGPRTDRTRLLLWVVLVISAGINASLSMVNMWAGSAAGVVLLATAAALIVNYRKAKR